MKAISPSINTITVKRSNFGPAQTEGQLWVTNEKGEIIFRCFTLELAWKNNLPKQSCIPAGSYRITPRFSQKYKHHLHILDVPNRSWILIHEANFSYELLGCIAVGRATRDINRDGLKDVTDSLLTKNQLTSLIKSVTTITIS